MKDFLTTFLADLVLLIHFAIAAFLVVGMLLIPLGAYWQWSWVLARRLRQIHAGFMVLITIETSFHFTCPLTTLEALLRHTHAPELFWAAKISKILYWDLPLEFFTIFYGCCVIWVLYLWISVPSRKIIDPTNFVVCKIEFKRKFHCTLCVCYFF